MARRTNLIINTVLLLGALTMHATERDNVVIKSAIEEYRLVPSQDGLTVKTLTKIQYEATKHSAVVVPMIYYNDVISLDKVSGGKAQYRDANSPSVFHDDSRICYFKADLKAKGAKASAEFRRTIKDGAYFSRIFLEESYPIVEKFVKIEIPAEFSHIEPLAVNFPEDKIIINDFVRPDGVREVNYAISGLPAMCSESRQPSVMASSPYILIRGYFQNVDSLYRYHRRMLDVDTVIPDVGSVLAQIIGDGAATERQRIARLYDYVQHKVRYVAFEEGEAGYRPDTPAEVLRKQYGDCKGMALLLATLLNRSGVEAYIASVGTNSIPFKISEHPTLAATNHMICIVPDGDGYLFLDPTAEYVSPDHVNSSIAGKDAMMFLPDGYRLVDIPAAEAWMSVDDMRVDYTLSDGELSGKIKRSYTGDMRIFVQMALDGVPMGKRDELMARVMVPADKVKLQPGNVCEQTTENDVYEMSAEFDSGNLMVDTGDAVYVDMNVSGHSFADRVDLTDRRSDYQLPFVSVVRLTAAMVVPEGYTVGEIPEDVEERCAGSVFSCRYTFDNDVVTMVKTMEINDRLVPVAELPQWNKTIARWNEASNRQIEFLKNK